MFTFDNIDVPDLSRLQEPALIFTETRLQPVLQQLVAAAVVEVVHHHLVHGSILQLVSRLTPLTKHQTQ